MSSGDSTQLLQLSRGKRERKEEKKAQLSGPRLWHGTGLQFPSRLALPGSLCSQYRACDSLHLFSNGQLPISASRPSSLPCRDRLLHPIDAGTCSCIPSMLGRAPASRRCSPKHLCHQLSPGPWWVPKRCPTDPAGRPRCFFSPPSHSLPPFPPRAAPGSEIAALYIKKGQISALVK